MFLVSLSYKFNSYSQYVEKLEYNLLMLITGSVYRFIDLKLNTDAAVEEVCVSMNIWGFFFQVAKT